MKNETKDINIIEKKIRECSNEEGKAKELIKQFSIKSFPTLIVDICSELGFKIFQDEIKDDMHAFILVSNELKEKLNTNKIIVVNVKDNIERRRFSIAHELGHYFINYKPDNEPTYFNAFEYLHNSSDNNEKRADYFAACLMMPEKQFSEKYKELSKDKKLNLFEKIDILSHLFVVPPVAVEKRITEELKLNEAKK